MNTNDKIHNFNVQPSVDFQWSSLKLTRFRSIAFLQGYFKGEPLIQTFSPQRGLQAVQIFKRKIYIATAWIEEPLRHQHPGPQRAHRKVPTERSRLSRCQRQKDNLCSYIIQKNCYCLPSRENMVIDVHRPSKGIHASYVIKSCPSHILLGRHKLPFTLKMPVVQLSQ